MRRGALTAVLTLALAGSALAYWTNGGTGSASATISQLTAPVVTATNPSGGVVELAWTASVLQPTQGSLDTEVGYLVERKLSADTAWSLVCGTDVTPKAHDDRTCTDTAFTVGGNYDYRVTARFRSWTATGTDSLFVVLDTTPPQALSIDRADANPTAEDSVSWDVTFSEGVTGVDATDFVLVASGTLSDSAITGVTGAGDAYTVTADSGTGEGTLRLDLIDDGTIIDAAANGLDAGFTGQAYDIDRTNPLVESITRVQATPTRLQTVQWTVTFDEPVTGFGTSDLVLVVGPPPTGHTAITGASITSVTGSGAIYTVTVNTGNTTGNGSLRLDLVDDGTIEDPSGNVLAGALDGGFTGETYAVDKRAPTVTATRLDPTPTMLTEIRWRLTFSEPVSGLVIANLQPDADVTITGAATTSLTGGPTIYDVTVATGTGDGLIRLELGYDSDDRCVSDAAGNCFGGQSVITGLTSFAGYEIDREPPNLVSILTADANNNGKVDRFVALFDETIQTPIATTPWTVANVPSGGTTITSVTRSGDAALINIAEGAGPIDTTVASGPTLALVAAANGIRSALGHQASFAATPVADGVAPFRTSMAMRDADTDGRVDEVAMTFSESLAAYTAGTSGWTLANVPSAGSLGSVAAPTGGTAATLTLNEGAGAVNTAVGTFTVRLIALSTGIRDAAGNRSSWSATAPADTAGPVPAAVTSGDGLAAEGDTVAVTLSEAIASTPASPVTATLSGGVAGADDTLTVPGLFNGAVALGRGDYVAADGADVTFAPSTLVRSGSQVTLTLGPCTANCAELTQAAASGNVAIAPAPSLTDAAGNPAAGAPSFLVRLF